MAKFTAPLFDSLARIFRFKGNKSLRSDFSVEAPIQPVYGLDRMAEFNAGYGQAHGFIVVESAKEHTSAGTQDHQMDPYARLASGGWLDKVGVPLDYEFWHLRTEMKVDSGDASEVGLCNGAIVLPYSDFDIIGHSDNAVFPVWNSVAGDWFFINDGVTAWAVCYPDPDGQYGRYIQYPILMPRGAQFAYRTTSSGTGTITFVFQHLMWFGPPGVLPPWR